MRLLAVITVFITLVGTGIAQDVTPWAELEDAPEMLFLRAQQAQEAEFWERAVELYTRGETLYPEDTRFPWALGNLYFNRQLFRLAWEEFRRVEKQAPYDPALLYNLSQTAAYLNEDHASVAYLERLLVIEPDNRRAIENLGWMYYKVHRLSEGRQLLVSAIERLGANADFAMTLGTIYSDLFRYDEGKEWYLEAIRESEIMGDRIFAAVAHYNLSILESRFYQFALAMERTNRSLESQNRASGRLARGELLLRRMEIAGALGEYQAAYEMDSSPLSKMNLAQAYQIAGRLEEARLYAEDCLKAEDESWMLNYGIDPVRYRRDIHEILKNACEGLANTEGFLARSGPIERVLALARAVRWRFKAAVHSLLFRKYSLMAADAYGPDSAAGGDLHLDALTQYYHAFQGYPRRAAGYLAKARAFEEPLIPPSAPSYGYEEGKTLNRSAPVREALEAFDPLWERDMLADAYTELVRQALKRRRGAEGEDAAERLYALNRGALRQKGIRLPAALLVEGGGKAAARRARRAVRQAGVIPASGRAALSGADARYTLRLTIDEAARTAHCELRDEGRGRTLVNRSLPFAPAGKVQAAFSRALSDLLFTE